MYTRGWMASVVKVYQIYLYGHAMDPFKDSIVCDWLMGGWVHARVMAECYHSNQINGKGTIGLKNWGQALPE